MTESLSAFEAFSLTSDGHTPLVTGPGLGLSLGQSCDHEKGIGLNLWVPPAPNTCHILGARPERQPVLGLGLLPLLPSSQALHSNWCQQVQFIPQMNLVLSCSATEKSSLVLTILSPKAPKNPK